MDLSANVYFTLAIIPALVANASPVAFSRFLSGIKLHPIDGGRNFIDGKRILGDGKTIEGFVLGVAIGTIVALIEAVLTTKYSLVVAGFISSFGAMLGDVTGSFIKRRLGIMRGERAPLLDQLDFYFGSVFCLWLYGVRTSLETITLLAIVVAVLHISTNYAAYKLGLKNVPW